MINVDAIAICDEWKQALRTEFEKPYFAKIKESYLACKANGGVIFPKASHTFEALNRVKPSDLKVVILGQDPYHGGEMIDGRFVPQAMGLSFSVPDGLKIPPSLQNIYKELHLSLGIHPPKSGNLTKWCDQGVLLLNSILSVEQGKPASHRHWGWEQFTDAVIVYIATHLQGVVFMLWGNYAKKKASLIDTQAHCVITAPHPSPLAQGFVGSGVFVKANEALKQMGKSPIKWEIL
ncbi:uracil-DNA glycosylase [Helicobacter enhydrae]|uniref:Uracil-DNA glycosylase n=1 Tax=Helicobacter enhydrae TaxID=222136 RepID=A0A1B1U5A5_9HELI|nr:uracil-DNA glycosylase [Helicobacter enhydrae]ANV97977.1 uracil-DNA glycosylase [Helicobacter enhydrae]